MRAIILLAAVLVAALAFSGCASLQSEKKAGPIGSLLDVDGQKVHVLTRAQENASLPPLVFIHGASTNLRDMNIAFGDMDFGDRTVVMVDRAGHGYSERPKDGHKLSVQAGQINKAIEQLGIENPIIIGQSFGGAVALAYALEYQADMSGLVLLAPVSHEWPGGIAWHNNVSQIPGVGFLFRRIVIPVYGQFAAADGIDGAFAPNIAPENYAERVGLPLLFRPKEFRSNAADIYYLKREVMAMQDRYGSLDLPVEVIAGEDDKSVYPDIHAKALGREIPGANLHIRPNTGHALHHSETAFIADRIRGIGQADTIDQAALAED